MSIERPLVQSNELEKSEDARRIVVAIKRFIDMYKRNSVEKGSGASDMVAVCKEGIQNRYKELHELLGEEAEAYMQNNLTAEEMIFIREIVK